MLEDPARRLDAVHLGHHEIHHHDVRAVEERELHGLPAGGSLGDHRDVGALQRVPDEAANERIIVGDDRPQHSLIVLVVLVNHVSEPPGPVLLRRMVRGSSASVGDFSAHGGSDIRLVGH